MIKLKSVGLIFVGIGGLGLIVIGFLELGGKIQLDTTHFYGLVLVFLGCLFLDILREKR